MNVMNSVQDRIWTHVEVPFWMRRGRVNAVDGHAEDLIWARVDRIEACVEDSVRDCVWNFVFEEANR